MQKDLLPRAHGDAALGRERLLGWLRASEAIDLPPDAPAALLAGAERELRAAVKRFEEAAHAVAPGKSPPEAVRQLEEDHPTAEQLLPTAETTLEALLALARDHRLLTLPEARPKVVEMPPFLWGFLLGSFPGPLEPRPNPLFYVDPVNRSWDRKTRDEHLRALNRSQLALTEAHEVLGHFAQLEAARRAPSLVQRAAIDEALSSGWALWADQLVVEAGFGGGDGAPDPARLRLAQRREALLALCRLVAALRVHGAGARLDDVVDVFSDEGYLEESVARREAERVVYDPAVLRPGLGLLALGRLRDEARAARGDRFSLADFNDQVIARGALPLGLLRRALLGESGSALY
jgi:hypothetical protein